MDVLNLKIRYRMIANRLIVFGLLFLLAGCLNVGDFTYPIVFTGNVVEVNDSSAVLSGMITNHGELPIIESGFIWGPHSMDEAGIRIRNKETPNSTFYLNTNQKILPGITFYARAYVQTNTTVVYGREVSFESPDSIKSFVY